MPYTVYSCPNHCEFDHGVVFHDKKRMYFDYDLVEEWILDKNEEFSEEEFISICEELYNSPILCPNCKEILDEQVEPTA